MSSLEEPVPLFSCIWSSMKRKVIGLGNIEGHYPGAWNFQGKIFETIYAPCKNIVMFSCLVCKIRSPHFQVYVPMKRKVIGLENIEGPYPGAWNFQDGSKGTIYAPCKNIVMLSCLVWKIRSPIFRYMYMFLYEAKSHRARKHRKPLPRYLKFSGLNLNDNLRQEDIHAPCKNIVMLSCLVWKI